MKTILPQEVQAKLEAGEALNIIDVREVNEVKEGHIAGIIHIPLKLLEFKMHELDKSKAYIIVCRSGGRSGQATAFLESYGYHVTNMTGGMQEWTGEVKQ
ncbi:MULTISPECIES: rhodanese-like domain-containing protein [Paenibacillus]|uniref:rhodanese-like domain-containing protein n=1 Tax=Paenibacillus TaxID=44249 RepID=UPI00203A8806|nr:rhodanese-like domain-containing protein [Paenibacillus camelliae]MCM3631847.1 rhodanese-like domain-containing protein [Paenibacillus camelliae]